MGGYIAIGVLVVLILILVVSSIHVVQQSKAFVVERLGSFSAVWGNGLHWKWPFIERVVTHARSSYEGAQEVRPQSRPSRSAVLQALIC